MAMERRVALKVAELMRTKGELLAAWCCAFASRYLKERKMRYRNSQPARQGNNMHPKDCPSLSLPVCRQLLTDSSHIEANKCVTIEG